MRLISTLLFCLGSHCLFAQTKIYLVSPKNNQDDYQFVNPHDTAYIELGCMMDMGIKYDPYWRFKYNFPIKQYNLPDGHYEVYLDDTLAMEGTLKKGWREGKWLEYYHNGKPHTLRNFKKGKLNGEQLQYSPDGALWNKVNFLNDIINGIETWYYPNGQIATKTYYNKLNISYKQEIFDSSGKMTGINHEHYKW
jgi:hypothetical protein